MIRESREVTQRQGSEIVWLCVLHGKSYNLIWRRRRLTRDNQCARCRKRKIKCTGDLQDGNGCEACQAAGVPRASCHYLRVSKDDIRHSGPSTYCMVQVNSHHLEEIVQVSGDTNWLYTTPASANYMSRSTTDPSQYALANASHVSHMPNPYAGSG